MYFFGSIEDTVGLYWGDALNVQGPVLPDCHYDEMSVQDLRNALAYARIAYERALNDDAPEEALEVLMASHDAVFEALAAVDEGFRERALSARQNIRYLGGYSQENIDKYRALASAS